MEISRERNREHKILLAVHALLSYDTPVPPFSLRSKDMCREILGYISPPKCVLKVSSFDHIGQRNYIISLHDFCLYCTATLLLQVTVRPGSQYLPPDP